MKKTVLYIFAATSLLPLTAATPAHDLSYADEIQHSKSSNSEHTSASSNEADAKSSVPSGFEHINNDYNGEVTLKDNYTTIGKADINYNELKDTITLSKQAKKKIIKYYSNKLTKQGNASLTKELEHEIPATTNLRKFYEAQSDIQTTYHLDYSTLSLHILVPSKYFTKVTAKYKYDSTYPAPTFYSPSLKSTLYAYYDYYSDSEQITWQTSGSVASGKTSLIYDMNNSIEDHVNDLYLEYQGKKYTYDIGYKEPDLNSEVSPYGNLWGIFVHENNQLLNHDFYSSYKTPLYLTLDKPYSVIIKHRGKTLYKNTLLQGEHIIETSNFPAGTYKINIIKRDLITNEIEETTELFSNQASEYNWLHSGLQIVAGLESEYFTSAFTDKTLYFHAQRGYNIYDNDLEIFYTFANDTSYIGAEYNGIYGDGLNYSISASISQAANIYFLGTANYAEDRSTYSATMYNGFLDDFSNTRDQYAKLQYNYTGTEWSFILYGNYNFEGYSTLSSTTRKNTTLGDVPASYYLTINYNDSSLAYYLGMSIIFDISKYISSVTEIGYSSDNNNYYISNSTDYENTEHSFVLDNQLYFGSANDSYNLSSITYSTDAADYTGKIDIEKTGDGTEIGSASVSINTNFYLTPSAYLFSTQNADSGYIVSLPNTKDPDEKKFNINNTLTDPGKTVLSPNKNFIGYLELNVIPESMQYGLKNSYWKEFFYPNNFYSPTIEIQKSCFVSFYADIPAKYNYTFLGMEDLLYGHGQQKSTSYLADGSKLTYVYLNKHNEKCETDTIVNCSDKNHIDLGKLRCKEDKK